MSVSFAYQVRDPRGNTIDGVIEAANPDDAAQLLRREGFQILALKEEAPANVGSLIPRRVTRSEIMYVTNQLAVMVDTGINLAIALEGIGSEEQNPTLKRILTELRNAVEQGDDFSTSLAK